MKFMKILKCVHDTKSDKIINKSIALHHQMFQLPFDQCINMALNRLGNNINKFK